MYSDSAIYAVLAIANLALIGWVVLLVKSGSGGTSGLAISLGGRFDAIERNNEVLRRQLTDMDRDLRSEMSTGVSNGLAAAFDKVQQGTKAQAEQFGTFRTDLAEGLGNVQRAITAQQEQLRDKVETKLEEIRTGNEAKLEQMRKAVDEQLQSALEKGLGESFQRVTEQFAQVQQAIGQVQSVAGQIGDLKRLFSNVKARGGVGEDLLQALLDDVLPTGSYVRNFRVGDEGADVVEFAVRMPRRGPSDDVWLAIDSKFPTEDYDRLLLASESGDRDQETVARKALDRKIRDEGKRIKSKYIKPPQTMEIAIMFLPNEGLYSEVYRIPGLIETLRRQYAITVMGPGLLPAFLHCIRVGYDTLALEKKAGAIREILSAVKAEWGNLGNSLDMLARRAETLNNGIKDTQRRTRVVGRTLKEVSAVDFERAEQVLGLSNEAMLIESEVEDEIPVLLPSLGTAHGDAESLDAAE